MIFYSWIFFFYLNESPLKKVHTTPITEKLRKKKKTIRISKMKIVEIVFWSMTESTNWVEWKFKPSSIVNTLSQAQSQPVAEWYNRKPFAHIFFYVCSITSRSLKSLSINESFQEMNLHNESIATGKKTSRPKRLFIGFVDLIWIWNISIDLIWIE